MPSSQNAAIQILESPLDNERVEVLLEQENATANIVLRYSTWTDGLGWCNQKTIHLDAQHLDGLHRAITVARHRVNRSRADAGDVVPLNNLIQLPTLS